MIELNDMRFKCVLLFNHFISSSLSIDKVYESLIMIKIINFTSVELNNWFKISNYKKEIEASN